VYNSSDDKKKQFTIDKNRETKDAQCFSSSPKKSPEEGIAEDGHSPLDCEICL
jgi:hypothetical protein